jgi:hypothetical protein
MLRLEKEVPCFFASFRKRGTESISHCIVMPYHDYADTVESVVVVLG